MVYPYNFKCDVRYIFGFVREIITCRGVAVERRIRDREVAGSGLGQALRRKNSGQVSHTYGCLLYTSDAADE